jgi:hypothetical protein
VVYRVANGVWAALFLYAVVVQFNDPDPLAWIAWYGFAAMFCLVGVADQLRPAPVAAYAVLALLYAGLTIALGEGTTTPMGGFPYWGVLQDEVVREALGLTLVGSWLGFDAAWTWKRKRIVEPA